MSISLIILGRSVIFLKIGYIEYNFAIPRRCQYNLSKSFFFFFFFFFFFINE
jgi:hypothetical protein